MATLDNTLDSTGLAGGSRWQHPKLLVILSVLALGLTVNAVAGGGAISDRLQWKGVELFSPAALDKGGLASPARVDYVKACARMEQIVHTACGLRQRDHDAAGIRQCMAYELKYTMWSAYGCG